MNILETIGLRIREIRVEKQLTQEALGERIGASYSYVGRIERGQKNISLQTLEKIAKALEVSEADFFTYSLSEETKQSEKMREIREITVMLYKQDLQSIVKIKPVLQEMLKQMKK
ncbi:helix-turn-helix transcriptional regulator [Acinetobacter sp. CUI P1]|nr:helix-turn-helix transcriptional regulator [Acinetobacter sp. CUI P1]